MTGSHCIICGIAGFPVCLNDLQMFRCPRCDLVWLQNLVIPQEGYYEKKEAILDNDKHSERTTNALERVDTFGRIINLDNLCDIGCGEGVFLEALKIKKYHGGWGIEPNHASVIAGQARGLPVVEGSANHFSLTLSSSPTRTASLFHVIEHLVDPFGTLSSIADKLPVGGHLILEIPNLLSYSFQRSGYRNKLIKAEHLFYFNPHNLRLLIEKTGLSVIAEGIRDFNVNAWSIRELLYRLGFPGTERKLVSSPLKPEAAATHVSSYSGLESWFKKIIRTILLWLVLLLHRVDYCWLVAEKRLPLNTYNKGIPMSESTP